MGRLEFKMADSPGKAADYVSHVLLERLNKGHRILWLVPGGSAIEVAVAAAKGIAGSPNIELLSVSLTDERYGAPGHKDSNWQQLADRGFNPNGAALLPVLKGKDFEATAADYAQVLSQALADADYTLALGGMGADGHIFGIKPHSPAIDSLKDAIAYEWEDYPRLALTARFIGKLDEAVIYAVGKEKHRQFDKLKEAASPADQPAQLLKQLPRVTIFNDYIGEKI